MALGNLCANNGLYLHFSAVESADPNEEVKQENRQEAPALIETFMAQEQHAHSHRHKESC